MFALATHLFALLAYVSAAIFLALRLAQPETGRLQSRRLAMTLLAIALLAHLLGLFGQLVTPKGLDLSIANAVSLFGWVVAALLGLAALRRPVENLGLLLLPLCGVSALLPELIEAAPRAELHQDWRLPAHVLSSLLGYGLLTLAAAQALLVVLQESMLRRRGGLRWLRALPPLETMDAFLFQIIAVGYVCISFSLATGLLFLEDPFAQHLLHKTVLSIAAWLIFSMVLLGRWRRGWRGLTAVRYTLAGYFLLVLAYFGSKFVLEVLLDQQWG